MQCNFDTGKSVDTVSLPWGIGDIIVSKCKMWSKVDEDA